MRIRFEVDVTEDHHVMKLSGKFLTVLRQEVAAAVCANEQVEGNAVECKVSEVLFSPQQTAVG